MRCRYALIVLMLGLLSSCVTIPADGPVHAVDQSDVESQSSTRFAPAGPRAGASRTDIVHGFLESMLAYPESLATANQFLTPKAARTWDPQATTSVYSTARVATPASGDNFRIELNVSARLDAQGRLTQVNEREYLPVRLEQHEGEWRISQPPSGVLLSEDFMASHMRPFELFFFDESGSRLIAEPVHAIVGEKLASTLIQRLAVGPQEADGTWQRTYMPAAQHMQASVPLIDNRAEVEIGIAVGNVPVADVDRMTAQIIATLSDVPGVDDVRITARDGLIVDTSESRQEVQSWASFSLGDSRRHAHVVANNRVWRIDSLEPRPAPGFLAKDAQGARSVALSRERLAAIWPDQALSATLEGDALVHLVGQDFLEPVVDVADTAWFIDNGADESRIRVVDAQGTRRLSLPKLLSIESFAVSPDGSRLAAVDETGEIFLARIVRKEGRVRKLNRFDHLDVNESDIGEVQWLTASTLLFTTKNAPRQLREVRIDGSRSVTSWSALGRWLPDVVVNRLVVSPGAEPLVTVMDSKNRLWIWESSGWERVNINKAKGLS